MAKHSNRSNSISANIALGTEPQNIDQEAVEKAAKIANLNDFILNELPSKYETLIGENGTKLSGGQRQRIGIARALIKNPDILIFDESTSFVDKQTENEIIEFIRIIKKEKTIIYVTHDTKLVHIFDETIDLDKF